MERPRVPCTPMRYVGPALSSIIPLFARWRSSLDEEPPRLADALRSEAERCFRLAQGIASFELAADSKRSGTPLNAKPRKSKPHRGCIGRPAMRWSISSQPNELV